MANALWRPSVEGLLIDCQLHIRSKTGKTTKKKTQKIDIPMTVGIVCVPLISLLNQVLWVFSFGWLGPFPPQKLPIFPGDMPQKPPLLSWSNAEAKSFSMTLSLPSIRFRLVSRPCCSTGCVQFSFLPYIVYMYTHPISSFPIPPTPQRTFCCHTAGFQSWRSVGWLVVWSVGLGHFLLTWLSVSIRHRFELNVRALKTRQQKPYSPRSHYRCVCVCVCVCLEQ